MVRKRRVPLRKCIVTKEMKPKEELIRIVRTRDKEVFVDPTGKKNGRGAYISKDKDVIERAIQLKVLEDEFKLTIDDSVYESLKEMVEN
ncbi:MAG TPA: YlxR family protein [Bacillota bacterium]|nr:YlxR family protein [Bacillota bacterium]